MRLIFSRSGWSILVLLLGYAHAVSQSRITDDLYLGVSYRPGLVFPEYSLFTYLVEDYVYSFEWSVAKRSSGKNYWHQIYHYPEFGVAVQYATLGNKDVFGSAISVYPFYNIHIWDEGKFSLLNKSGIGLGMVSKKFDLNDNLYNVAMGSTLNFHFNFELNAQFQLQKNILVTAGAGMDHLSNGNFGEPNLGINYFTLHGGIRYLAGTSGRRTSHVLVKHVPVTSTSLILALGTKNSKALIAEKFFVSSLSFEVKRSFWRIFSPGLGADLFFDSSTKRKFIAGGKVTEYKSIHDFRTGLHLSQAIVYNQFSVTLQEGVYVLVKDTVFKNHMYNRLIVRQKVNQHLFFQLAFKSHGAVLDYIEFGVGYSGKS